jgi:hypothetical protein
LDSPHNLGTKKIKYEHEQESASAYQEIDERVEGRAYSHLWG